MKLLYILIDMWMMIKVLTKLECSSKKLHYDRALAHKLLNNNN